MGFRGGVEQKQAVKCCACVCVCVCKLAEWEVVWLPCDCGWRCEEGSAFAGDWVVGIGPRKMEVEMGSERERLERWR